MCRHCGYVHTALVPSADIPLKVFFAVLPGLELRNAAAHGPQHLMRMVLHTDSDFGPQGEMSVHHYWNKIVNFQKTFGIWISITI
jgi:hypothetical protein